MIKSLPQHQFNLFSDRLPKSHKNLFKKIFFACYMLGVFLFHSGNGYAQTTQNFIANGSWTCPVGVSSITVECWGGGGAGGGVTAGLINGAGGGGGGSAYASSVIPVTPGIAYSYVVGAGGAINSSGGAGGAGGSSWFGSAATVLAAGGGGGINNNGAGGAGGNAGTSIGTTVFGGGNGAAGVTAIGGGGGGAAGSISPGGTAVGITPGTGGVVGGGNGAAGTTANANNTSVAGLPGGGGGGPRTGSGGGLKTASPGGRGQINITYTQLTYKSALVSMNYGSVNWCAGETRNVTIQIQNVGTATWTDGSPDINVGVKWNTNGANWTDYYLRLDAGNLAPGAIGTFTFPIMASNNTGGGYTTPLAAGVNNLSFDLVYEGVSWFGNNGGGVGPGNVKFTSPNITIQSLPAITAHPSTTVQTRCQNVAATALSVTATGTGLSYQWYSNTIASNSVGTAIGGATTASFTPPTAIPGTLYYYCIVSGACSPAVTSNISGAIIVNAKPVAGAITGASTVCIGSPVTLTPNASGSGTLTYTWLSSAPAIATVSNAGLVTALAAGTTNITFTVTDATTCSSTSASFAVSVTRPTAGSITGLTKVCIGNTINLSSNATGAAPLTYSWSSSNAAVATVNSSGAVSGLATGTTNITYIVTDGNGCPTTSAAFPVTVTKPTAAAITGAANVCIGNNTNLSANASGVTPLTYTWASSNPSVASVTNTGVVTGSATGSTVISYTVTDGNGCSTTSAGFSLTVTLATAGAVTGASEVCTGSTIALTPNALGTGTLGYGWTSSNTAVAIVSNAGIVTGVASGTANISYTVTDGNACSATSPSFTVTVYARPQASITSANTSICNPGNTSITGTVTANGNWTITLSSGATQTGTGNGNFNFPVSPAATTTYTITSLVDQHCSSIGTDLTGSTLVTVNEPVVITTQPDATQTTCATFPVSFTVAATGSGLTYQWYHNSGALIDNSNISGATTATLNIDQAGTADAGTYYVIISGLAPCATAQSNNSVLIINQEIVINTQPAIQSVCTGGTAAFTIDASGTGIMYQWRRGTTVLVDGGRISGVNTSTLTITNVNAADAATNYNVVLTSPGGACPQSNSANVQLIVKPLPEVTATSPSTSICSGNSTAVTLSSNVAGATFSWTVLQTNASGASAGSGSNIAQMLTATGNTAGTVDYIITPSANGCDGAPFIYTITVNPAPDATATPASQTICSGGAPFIGLTGTITGTTFSWTVAQTGVTGATAGSGPDIAQVLTATGTIAGTAVYTITPSANGCNGTPVTVTITVNPSANVMATPASQTICSGNTSSVALTGTVPNATFSWTVVQTGVSGATSSAGSGIAQTLTSTGSSSGTAVYTITPSFEGCGGSVVTVTITVDPKPVVTATPASQIICSGAAPSIALTSNVAATSFSWTVVQTGVTGATASNGTSIAQILTTTGTVPGTAVYTITPSANGCAGNPVSVTITVNPKVTITPLAQSICNSGAITPIAISGGVTGTITSWTRTNPAGITSAIPLSGSGSISGSMANSTAAAITVTFTINATASNGCLTTTSATVIVFATINAPIISASQILCVGSSAAPLTATLPTGGSTSGYTYQWQVATATAGPWTNIAGATGNTYAPPATPRYYRLIVNNSCGLDTSNVVQISTAADFGLTFGGNNPSAPLCSGSTFSFEIASGSISGSLGGGRYIRYSWQSQQPGYFTSGTTNPYGTTETISVFGIVLFTWYEGNATFTVNNNTNAPVTQNLVITPNVYNSNGTLYCNLSPEIIPVTINPKPVIPNSTAAVCSGTAFTATPVNGVPTASVIVPASTRYAWSAPVVTGGLTGGSAQTNQTTISQTLTNPTNVNQTATYTVTPTYIGSPNCPGNTFTVIVTVNPKPVIANRTVTACNNVAFNVVPVNAQPTTIVPAGTTYSWPAPIVTGGITGGSAQTGQASISQTLVNPTNTPQTATYTVTPTAGACPGATFTVIVTVNPTPVATFSAAATTICQSAGTNILFTGTANTTVTYTINGGLNQTITLNGSGTATLPTGGLAATTTYALVSVSFPSATCTQPLSGSVTVTVNPAATASISANPVAVCAGQNTVITFTGTPNAVVTYKIGAGINQTITLNAAGTASLTLPVTATTTYTLVSVAYVTFPSCPQPLTANTTVTVNPNASAGLISGTSPLCIGITASYTSNGNAGGTWSSTNTAVATVDINGLVTALSAGTANITYTVSTGCNSPVSAFKTITISANANAGTVSGSASICTNTQVLYSSSGGNTGGVWSSSVPSVATVNNFGIVTGVSIGTSTITYTVSTGCNAPVSSSQVIQVLSPAPASSPGAITGPAHVCTASAGFNYSVLPVANATTYVWTIPAGWSITAGAGTNSITVTSGTGGGNITVVAGNSCGFSSPSILAVTSSAPGQWRGITANWNDTQNWCSGVPTATTNVVIPAGTPNDPVISSAVAFTKNLTILAGATVTIDGQVLKIAGNVSSSAALNSINGIIEMTGSAPQTLAGGMFVARTIMNLKISNGSGVSFSGTIDTLKISGLLSFGTGNATLTTNNNLTLLSSASGTASVGDMTENGLYTGNTITGSVTVERYIPNHSKAWQFLAVPTSGQSVNASWQEGNAPLGNTKPGHGTIITSNNAGAVGLGFDIYTPTGPTMKTYEPLTDNWTGIASPSISVANKKGYMLFVRGDRSVTAFNQAATPTVLRTTGKLYTTGADAPPSSTVLAGKLESVGNPYASAINFTQVTRSAGVDAKFYVWDPLLTNTYYGLGGYQTISSVNGWKPVPGGTANYDADVAYPVIQSGQAFFVFSTTGGGTVSFTEPAKVTGSSMIFRPSGELAGSLADRQFFGLSLYNGTTATAALSDGNVVAFDADLSNNIDADDAVKILNTGENIGISRGGKNLSVEARGRVVLEDTIFYNMGNLRGHPYQLRFRPENMGAAAMTAYLVDRFTNVTTELSLLTTTSVDFNVTAEAGSYAANRFYVVFRPVVIVPVLITHISATRSGNLIRVNWKVENETGIQQYEVERSADGRRFQTLGITGARLNNGGSASYSDVDEEPLGGDNFYRIKALNRSGEMVYSAIVKVTGEMVADQKSIVVYPNPVTGKRMNVRFVGYPAGEYRLELSNKLGQVVYSNTVQVSGRDMTGTVQLGTVSTGNYQLRITGSDKKSSVQQVIIE